MNSHDNLNGVKCTMLLPYSSNGNIDFSALKYMVDWYIDHGCTGLFAMCHSTELHWLSMAERLSVIHHVSEYVKTKKNLHGYIPDVIAAGTFSTDLSQMVDEINQVAAAGADAVVLITNRLDPDHRGANCWKDRAETLLDRIPNNIPLGLYECPMPYKYILSDEEISWAKATNRFYFIKDTCCDPEMLQRRLAILQDSKLRLFNANAQTFLFSLKLGAAGYSSVMSSIHPQLYAWMCDHFIEQPEKAETLQHMLCFTSFSESLSYPLIAKYVMQKDGLPILINSRTCPNKNFNPYDRHIMDQLISWTKEMEQYLGS